MIFSGGSCNFHIKNTLKSEIFNDKKRGKKGGGVVGGGLIPQYTL